MRVHNVHAPIVIKLDCFLQLFVIETLGLSKYRTRALLGVCAYISTGSKPPLNSEYAPNSKMDNLIWVGIN